jgi:serine/threonine protein kinase
MKVNYFRLEMQYKLIDFGVSNFDNMNRNTEIGTSFYMAPEIFDK